MDSGKSSQPVSVAHEIQKFVAISHCQNPETKTGQHAKHADDGALARKIPEICRLVAPSALSIPISRVFWTTNVICALKMQSAATSTMKNSR